MPPELRASIVITNHNYAAYLGEAVESALAQRVAPAEVVVVDDGSTDGSRDLLERYAGRVRTVLKPNGGMASALNAGFAASSGDPVVFLDADDTLLPSALEGCLPLFDDTRVVRVQWPLLEVDSGGAPTGRVLPESPLPEGDLRELLVRDGPLAAPTPPTSGTAWRRSLLASAFPIPEPAFARHCDTYLSTVAGLAGVTRVLSEPQARYRVHGANDYASLPRSVQNRRNLELYRSRCELLGRQLDRPPEDWLGSNAHYAWMRELDDGCQELAEAIPAGATFVLVDEDAWAGGAGLLPERRALPFTQRDGVYWGPPADDAAGARELHALRDAGASHVAVAEPAFWWLDQYPGLLRELERELVRIHEGPRTIVWAER